MSVLVLYKAVLTVLLITFAVLTFDIRGRPGERPLLGRLPVALVQVGYLGLIAWHVRLLRMVAAVRWFDLASAALLLAAVALAAMARADLGPAHTRLGCIGERGELVTSGVYRLVRHPFYAAICLYLAGAVITALLHAPMLESALYVAAAACALVILAVAGAWESRSLAVRFGERFERYRADVHPFLPLWRGRGAGGRRLMSVAEPDALRLMNAAEADTARPISGATAAGLEEP